MAGLLGAFLLNQLGRSLQRHRGLGGGNTIALDDVTLTSARLGLVGRPDRLIRQGDTVIVEEWKSARTVRPAHRAQMGVYFLLVEEQWGVVPPYGVIVLGDGSRQRIDNSELLRAWVLAMAGPIWLSDCSQGRGKNDDRKTGTAEKPKGALRLPWQTLPPSEGNGHPLPEPRL